jgi:hypothetical protein
MILILLGEPNFVDNVNALGVLRLKENIYYAADFQLADFLAALKKLNTENSLFSLRQIDAPQVKITGLLNGIPASR